jgi:hypothetical protein
MNRIATLCGVSAQAILNWIRAFVKEHYEKPAPEAARIRTSFTPVRTEADRIGETYA